MVMPFGFHSGSSAMEPNLMKFKSTSSPVYKWSFQGRMARCLDATLRLRASIDGFPSSSQSTWVRRESVTGFNPIMAVDDPIQSSTSRNLIVFMIVDVTLFAGFLVHSR